MYRLIDHKQNILRPKGDQSFHTVCAISGHWERPHLRLVWSAAENQSDNMRLLKLFLDAFIHITDNFKFT